MNTHFRITIFLSLCLVHLLHIFWKNSIDVFMLKTQWYQYLHAIHILIGKLMISLGTCRRFHEVWYYVHCQIILIVRQRVSRYIIRIRNILHTIQGGGIFQINIICDCGFTCTFYFCNPDSPKNVPIFDYHHCTLDFFLCLISFMTTSMRVTFIIFKWAQNQHLHI